MWITASGKKAGFVNPISSRPSPDGAAKTRDMTTPLGVEILFIPKQFRLRPVDNRSPGARGDDEPKKCDTISPTP